MGIVADSRSSHIISRCRIPNSDRRRSVAEAVIPNRNRRAPASFGRITHRYTIIGFNRRYTGILIVCRSRFRIIADSHTVFRVSFGTCAFRDTVVPYRVRLSADSKTLFSSSYGFIPHSQGIFFLCLCFYSYSSTVLSRSRRARPPDYPACCIRISRKHTAGNHHGAQKRAKRTDSRHRGFIISADPLRDFRNDYVAILHPAPYDLVYLIHNFNPILSLL